jgi:ubiquinone/menaquinone biosynthesis C-methylase UbiE
MTKADHWDDIYQRKAEDELSWHRDHLEQSLSFIAAANLQKNDAIIDVGGGTSSLVDDLVAFGYSDLTVLDLSAAALDVVKQRLGPAGHSVHWIADDVTTVKLPKQHFRFWHDRAVFHFLRNQDQRQRYVDAVAHAVQPGGHVLIATFSTDGPVQCSGLEVERYDEHTLHGQFGDGFVKVRSVLESHVTPWGKSQEFLYCHCLRKI